MLPLPVPLVTIVAVAMMVVIPGVQACFDKALDTEHSWSWLQPLSMENRLYYYVDSTEPSKLMAESEQNQPKYFKREYVCLEDYESHGMMVQMVENSGKPHFQCLRFETLAKNVVRLYKTKLRALKKKVDCMKETFEADEAMMVAHDFLQPQPCPLQGGYQMLLHEGEIIHGHCLDSVKSYNPSFRFQCDKYNVIADFGRDCEPPILSRLQKMRRRHIAHLHCVGSWNEKGDIRSVLLQMRDMPYTYWCIHYRQVNMSNELLSIFMTLDGRCVADAFHNEDVPKKTSLFGHLASYVPIDDPRCSDAEYLDECRNKRNQCFDSDECPANCQRCNVKSYLSGCQFMEASVGSWKTVNSRSDMSVNISTNRIRVDKYGEFSCRANAEKDLRGLVYPVIQADEQSTCLPYYACAQVFIPAPGVLEFFLRPAWRNEETGVPFTCSGTDDKIGYVIPAQEEQTITMVNTEKLIKTSCGFDATQRFPTMTPNCMMDVEKCNSGCYTLEITYNNVTCPGQYSAGLSIETSHICYGRFDFTDNVRGILTYSMFSERYFCWIYNHNRLFIATPQQCNVEQVKRILSDRNSATTYDPINVLSKPFHASKDRDGNHAESLCFHRLVMLTALWLPLSNYFLNL